MRARCSTVNSGAVARRRASQSGVESFTVLLVAWDMLVFRFDSMNRGMPPFTPYMRGVPQFVAAKPLRAAVRPAVSGH